LFPPLFRRHPAESSNLRKQNRRTCRQVHVPFGRLERDVVTVAHDLGPDLDQLLP